MKAVFRGDTHALRRLHFWLTIIWFVAAFPICLFLANSIPLLVFVSVYANVAGHFAAWQSVRAEQESQTSPS